MPHKTKTAFSHQSTEPAFDRYNVIQQLNPSQRALAWPSVQYGKSHVLRLASLATTTTAATEPSASIMPSQASPRLTSSSCLATSVSPSRVGAILNGQWLQTLIHLITDSGGMTRPSMNGNTSLRVRGAF